MADFARYQLVVPKITVRSGNGDSSAAFMKRVRDAVGLLAEGELFGLDISIAHGCSLRILKVFLNNAEARRLCSLEWRYSGKGDVMSLVPKLVASCPHLTALNVIFDNLVTSRFISDVLMHPDNKIRELRVPPITGFEMIHESVLQSRVTSLKMSHPDRDTCKFLALDRLECLEVSPTADGLLAVMAGLSKCTRLHTLAIQGAYNDRVLLLRVCSSKGFSKSITSLSFHNCLFTTTFDWHFLVDSNIRDLELCNVRFDDNWDHFATALSDLLDAKGMNGLRLGWVNNRDSIIDILGTSIGKAKSVRIDDVSADRSCVDTIALALQSPDCEMESLMLWYTIDPDDPVNTLWYDLAPALKRPECTLKSLKLEMWAGQRCRVVRTFRLWHAMFALLLARNKPHRKLRKLPVEMFRLVGQML